MSVSRKVLRRMKKVMGVIGTSAVLAPCSSQVSFAAKKTILGLHFPSGKCIIPLSKKQGGTFL